MIDHVERLLRESPNMDAAVDDVLAGLSRGADNDTILARVLHMDFLDFDAWPLAGGYGYVSVMDWLMEYTGLLNDKAPTTADILTGERDPDDLSGDWVDAIARAMLDSGWFQRWPDVKPKRKDVMLALEKAGWLKNEYMVHPGQQALLGVRTRRR
jgi:hypothetical protein